MNFQPSPKCRNQRLPVSTFLVSQARHFIKKTAATTSFQVVAAVDFMGIRINPTNLCFCPINFVFLHLRYYTMLLCEVIRNY